MKPEESKRAIYQNKKPPSLPREARDNPLSQFPELLTETVFLIGNGKSRENFDLNLLRGKGTIVGCNALYRTFTPDVLIAIDAKLIKEIKDARYDKENIVLLPANRSIALDRCIRWRANSGFNTSGCFGMKFIKDSIKAKKCYMLGMDGYKGNMFDGTKNYAAVTLQNFNGINRYYHQVLKEPGDTEFINVNTRDEWMPECHDTGKYRFISYDEFFKEVKI